MHIPTVVCGLILFALFAYLIVRLHQLLDQKTRKLLDVDVHGLGESIGQVRTTADRSKSSLSQLWASHRNLESKVASKEGLAEAVGRLDQRVEDIWEHLNATTEADVHRHAALVEDIQIVKRLATEDVGTLARNVDMLVQLTRALAVVTEAVQDGKQTFQSWAEFRAALDSIDGGQKEATKHVHQSNTSG